jgi:Flp pilus assembly protein protease CpaA
LKELSAGVFLIISVISDLRSKKISNQMIISFFVIGLIIQVMLSGFSGLWISASSFAAAFTLGLPFYLMRMFGGGDFKLLMAISVLLQWQVVAATILISFIWGALLGVLQVALKGQLPLFFSNLFAVVKRKPVSENTLHMIPFSVAIFFGCLTSISLSQMGFI